jgi:uncharacterized phage protein (TIGR01671 family)
MRAIKFRAWNKNLDIFVNPAKYLSFYKDELNHNDWIIPLQFTGLLDKNDKEIYEGDIATIIPNMELEETYTGEIVFGQGQFYLSGFQYDGYAKPTDFTEQLSNLEIIGNLYENPELVGK